MKLAIKATAILILTALFAKITYAWPALDSLFSSQAWQRLYVMLATWFNVTGPEEGDNLVMVVVIATSFALAVLLVALGERFIIRPLCKAWHDARQHS
jgi:hypothetical protein